MNNTEQSMSMRGWLVGWRKDGEGGYFKSIDGSLYRLQKRCYWRVFCELELIDSNCMTIMTAKLSAHRHARETK